MIRMLINSNGCYYALGYCLSASVIASQFKKKRIPIVAERLLSVVFLVLILTIMHLTAGVKNISFLFTMMIIVLLLFTQILVVCDTDMMGLGTMTIRAFMMGETSASFAWMLFYRQMGAKFSAPFVSLDFLMWILMMVLVYGCFSVLQYMVEKRNMEVEALEVPTKPADVLILVSVVLLIYFISNMSYVSEDGLFSTTIPRDIFIIHTMTDLVGVMFLYAYELQRREVSRVFEVNTLQSEMAMQQKYYQLSKESMDMVNQKYHDLKHQIVLLKEQTSADKQKYLEQMEQEIQIYEAQNKTGNHVLDIMLTSKSLICHAEGIQLRTIAAGEELAIMKDLDISALFGNILDNAIEAELRVKDREKRMIRVLVEPRKSFLVIQVSNYCEEKLDFIGGIPQSTKNDHRIHGFGIKSIQSIVNNYHGSVRVTVEDNWFQVKILIPK